MGPAYLRADLPVLDPPIAYPLLKVDALNPRSEMDDREPILYLGEQFRRWRCFEASLGHLQRRQPGAASERLVDDGTPISAVENLPRNAKLLKLAPGPDRPAQLTGNAAVDRSVEGRPGLLKPRAECLGVPVMRGIDDAAIEIIDGADEAEDGIAAGHTADRISGLRSR